MYKQGVGEVSVCVHRGTQFPRKLDTALVTLLRQSQTSVAHAIEQQDIGLILHIGAQVVAEPLGNQPIVEQLEITTLEQVIFNIFGQM